MIGSGQCVRERQRVRGGRDLAHGGADDVAVATRQRLESLQSHQQRAGLGNGQSHGFGKFSRVTQVNVAVVPGRIDELIGHVTGPPADEQCLQVRNQFLVGDAEVPGCFLQLRPLVGVHVTHDVQQPCQVLFRAGLGGTVPALLPPDDLAAAHAVLEFLGLGQAPFHRPRHGPLGFQVRAGGCGHSGVRAGCAHVFGRALGVGHRQQHGVEALGQMRVLLGQGCRDLAQELGRALTHVNRDPHAGGRQDHARELTSHGEILGGFETVPGDGHLGNDPGQPERALRLAVLVPAGQVPRAETRAHTPGLYGAPAEGARAVHVIKADRAVTQHRGQQRLKCRVRHGHGRLDVAARGGLVGQCRFQLVQGSARQPVLSGVVPGVRGDRKHRRFFGAELDLGQLVRTAGHPIARRQLDVGGPGVVVRDFLDRVAQGAQVRFVSLEHSLERVVATGLVVPGNDLPQLIARVPALAVQQRNEQVEEPLRRRCGGAARDRT